MRQFIKLKFTKSDYIGISIATIGTGVCLSPLIILSKLD
jgi:hypothetical protein